MEENVLTTYFVGEYIFGRLLGEGSTAKVYLGIHKETGKRYAIKIIDKSIFSNRKVKTRLEREITLMKIVRSDYIVQVHQVYETSSHVFMVLDYMDGGELYDLITKRHYLDVTTTIILFTQMLNCLSYLNSKNICHRDIKPENILLDSTYSKMKTYRFWFSCYVDDETLKEYCGSPGYTAPEVISKQPFNPFLADVYSCGVLLHVMLYGRLPEKNTNEFPDNHGSGDLLTKMLQDDPNKRISLQEVMKHPFVNDALTPIVERPIAMYSGPPVESVDSDLISTICGILPNLHVSRVRNLLATPSSNTVKEIYRLLDSRHYNSPSDFQFSRSGSTVETLFASQTCFPVTKCECNDNIHSFIVYTASDCCSEINLKTKIDSILYDLDIVDSKYSTIDKKVFVYIKFDTSVTENGCQVSCNGCTGSVMFDDLCKLFRILITE
ncbi:non-specific serine/threonine protein kinase [Entamoeba marina]